LWHAGLADKILSNPDNKQMKEAIIAINLRHRLVWASQGFVVLWLIWLALNGWNSLAFGLMASLAGAALGAWLATEPPHPWRPHRLILFSLYFLWESLLGGIDVAWRAMHPRLRIEPCFKTHRLDLPAGQPRTLMISVVSLLPGTLSASIQGEDTLLVHALTPEASSSVEQLQRWIAWLFSVEPGPAE
jgi:multicomponent Na+:H+ antiporter subunit E